MSLFQEMTYVIRKLNRRKKKGNLSFVTNLRQKGNSNKCALLTAAPGNFRTFGWQLTSYSKQGSCKMLFIIDDIWFLKTLNSSSSFLPDSHSFSNSCITEFKFSSSDWYRPLMILSKFSIMLSV
jgi:hypothetical protein